MHLLLHCCAKDAPFQQLVDFDNLCGILQPLLHGHGSGSRFLALLCLSYFVCDATSLSEQQKQIFEIENSDIKLLKLHLMGKQITPGDALHLIKASTLIPANVPILQNNDIQTFVSQFLDDDEGSLAAEVITTLQSQPKSKESSAEDLLKILMPLLWACNATIVVGGNISLNLDSSNRIHQLLQSLNVLLEKDPKPLLHSIPEHLLEATTMELSVYIKLHLRGT